MTDSFADICDTARAQNGVSVAQLGVQGWERLRESNPAEYHRLIAIQAGLVRSTPLYEVILEKFLRPASVDLHVAEDMFGQPLE